MFTGIVEEQGTVLEAQARDGGRRIVIEANAALAGTKIDDSISVSGVCLTVVAIGKSALSFDAVPETLARSTLGSVVPGTRVNLERAMSADQRFGGHYVQGHVDTRATIIERVTDGNGLNVRFKTQATHRNLITEKGFITVDGVSLTVTEVSSDKANESLTFGVTLVPHTRARVTLGQTPVDSEVNLEFDVFAKYVARAVDERLMAIEEQLELLRQRIK